MAIAKKATTKKAPAKTSASRKAAPKATKTIKDSADKAVNVYLGLIGKGLDVVQENIESARKDGGKQVSLLEKRGVQLRKNLTKRIKGIDLPDSNSLARDAKKQINKAQNKVESVVENVADDAAKAVDALNPKKKPAPKRRSTAKKAA